TSFDGGICVVTIDRPPVNSLNTFLMEALIATFQNLPNNADLRAIVITGGGRKAFVAGADITEVKDLMEIEGKAFSRKGQAMTDAIADCPLPVICAINGAALGGGGEIALACDIRIMAENALIGFPESSLGLFPGAGGTQRLPRLVTQGMAKYLLLTATPITASEAEHCGLVDKVVPREKLMEASIALARKISKNGPIAIKAIKRLLNKSYDVPLEEGLSMERDEFGKVCASNDKVEGITAFFEKRKPIYTGK
ncbi:MAG: enoyl-CoA hydratase/isomerase family protein, partial [Deltaproteobacteria bacterium]|nr:enoyl-CoA hydratase/isomerase family protein [Deltaproteobacteria bacterium]